MLPQEDLIIFLLKQIQLKTEFGRTGAKILALKRRTAASVRAGRRNGLFLFMWKRICIFVGIIF